MARYRKKRFYRKKGRWSSNIKTLTNQNISAPSGSFYGTTILCQNPAQSDSTVSQQYTVKNIEFANQLEVPAGKQNDLENLISYIVYVPQGMIVTETYPNYHPEYIMAMRFYGSPETESTAYPTAFKNNYKIKTRLARRLQTGDSIQYLLVGFNQSNSATDILLNGVVRWWTKAN